MKRLLTTLLLLVLAATASAQTLDALKYSIFGAKLISVGEVTTKPGSKKGTTVTEQELYYEAAKGATITLWGNSTRKAKEGKYFVYITIPKQTENTSGMKIIGGKANEPHEEKFINTDLLSTYPFSAEIALKIDGNWIQVKIHFNTKPEENEANPESKSLANQPATKTETKPQEKKPDAKTIADGIYVIRFTNNPDYVLTLKDGKAVNDNIIHLWKWRDDNSQKWKITNENGKIAIRSMVNTNCALDVKNFNYGNNAEIILYGFHGGDNQLWVPERLDNGSYILKTAGNTDFCLDLFEGRAENGGVIELYYAHKLWPEWWTLEKVSK